MPRFFEGDVVVIESPVYGPNLWTIDPGDPDRLVGAVVRVVAEVDEAGDVCCTAADGSLVYVLEDGLTFREYVEPLDAAPESVFNFSDMHVTRRFNEIVEGFHTTDGEAFGESLTRSVVMSLAVNDPARPVSEDAELPSPVSLDTKEKAENDDARDILHSRDADGDKIKFAYNKSKGAILILTDPNGHWLKVSDIPALIRWLKSRETKHRGKGDAAGVGA